jgi:hypothetical protein
VQLRCAISGLPRWRGPQPQWTMLGRAILASKRPCPIVNPSQRVADRAPGIPAASSSPPPVQSSVPSSTLPSPSSVSLSSSTSPSTLPPHSAVANRRSFAAVVGCARPLSVMTGPSRPPAPVSGAQSAGVPPPHPATTVFASV